MSLRPCIVKLCTLKGLAARRILAARRAEPFALSTRAFTHTHQERNMGIIKQIEQTRESLYSALKTRNVEELRFQMTFLRKLFYTLPKAVRTAASRSYLGFTRAHVRQAAHLLATRSRKEDADAIDQLLRDGKPIYDVEVDSDLLLYALKALVQTGQEMKAYNLLQMYRGPTSPVRPNSQHWQFVMRGLARLGNVQRLRECLSIMKSTWPFPGNTHYYCLLEGIFRRGDPESTDEIRQVLHEMRDINLPYSPTISSLILQYEKENRHAWRGLSIVYKTNSRAIITNITSADIQGWIEELLKSRVNGKVAFDQKLRQLRQKGFNPDVRILAKMVGLGTVSSILELKFFQDALEVKANVVVWSIFIRNMLQKRNVQEALKAYELAKEDGIQPDATMLHPLLRAMCNGHIREPPEQMLDQALELYKDLCEGINPENNLEDRPEDSFEDKPATATSLVPKEGPDTAVYNTLLRALASSSNKRKYFPVAEHLLQDMHERRVDMDPMTTTSIAVLLIRSADSFEKAAAVYRQVCSVNSGSLDAKGYAAVLHAFCSLKPNVRRCRVGGIVAHDEINRHSIPPAHVYFEIVRDMRANGYARTPQVYTILLGRYAELATLVRGITDARHRAEVHESLRVVIEETHRQFTLDAGLAPDAPLLNQLMDAYNRVGSMDGVLQIWSTLSSTGLISNASVSIIFDACGYNRALHKADAIFRDLTTVQFPFNRRNWNSWVECLCRIGRLDDALKAVCIDMPTSVIPDKGTVKILLSFAESAGKAEEIRSSVKLYLPTLWQSLPEDMRC